MAELLPSRLWLMRFAYLGLALGIVFFHLLPLDTQPRRWAPPDLLIALTFTFAARRPDFVPALSVAGVMLVADLMLQRPPGLLAMLVLLGVEYLRPRDPEAGDSGLAAEWVAAAVVILAVLLGNRLVLWMMAVDQAPLSLTVIQALATVLCYPVVALTCQQLLGLTRLTQANGAVTGGRT